MWPLSLFPDCIYASSKSDYSYWHVLSVLYILLLWLFFVTKPYSSEQYLFTLLHFASPLSILPLWFPTMSSPPLSFILSFLNSISYLSTLSVFITFNVLLHHLTPFIPHCLSHSLISLLFFPSPSLFSVSVEPLWLHRYSDCWLCCWGGMLFRHSTRRYCITCTLPHTIKTTAACSKTFNHNISAYNKDLFNLF